jgi:vancomycin resistance protein YoaR
MRCRDIEKFRNAHSPGCGIISSMTKRNLDLASPRANANEPVPNLTQSAVIVPDDQGQPESDSSRRPLWLRTTGIAAVIIILLAVSFELVYAGKVYPGVSADGVSLAGSTQISAQKQLEDKTTIFSGQVVTIANGDSNTRIPVAGLSVAYDNAQAADLAYHYGRQGNWFERAREQLRALSGRATNFSSYKYDDNRLAPYIVQLGDDVLTPVADASLNFDAGQPQVTPAANGERLDYGVLIQMIADRLSQTSTDPVTAPVYQLEPQLTTASLQAVTNQLGGYLSGPITLMHGSTSSIIDQKTIISWIEVGATTPKPFITSLNVNDLYPPSAAANLGLSSTAVQSYVTKLAGELDQTAQNAGLAMQNGTLTVVQASRTGIKLDQAAAISDITATLKKPATDRQVNLKLATTQPDVNESNLSSLGITDQLSEGETYFPGSPSTRLINVRAGAAKFNNVLLAPGEQFSFGKILGEVDASTGYVPELVILGNHEEKQYGGGLCQVSTTAFRAALLAGLPINERVNHAFAISYYTWPYGVPGVDATIYYPQVDFKFTNDTGHYILIQTTMNGVDLKFDYFGTKAKTGAVRGPTFVTGTKDATQPSHTVFYRDVMDLAGNVTKTDKFDTYYKSSTDFPVTKQFN